MNNHGREDEIVSFSCRIVFITNNLNISYYHNVYIYLDRIHQKY